MVSPKKLVTPKKMVTQKNWSKKKRLPQKFWRTLLRGGLLLHLGKMAYFIVGGFIIAIPTLHLPVLSLPSSWCLIMFHHVSLPHNLSEATACADATYVRQLRESSGQGTWPVRGESHTFFHCSGNCREPCKHCIIYVYVLFAYHNNRRPCSFFSRGHFELFTEVTKDAHGGCDKDLPAWASSPRMLRRRAALAFACEHCEHLDISRSKSGTTSNPSALLLW